MANKMLLLVLFISALAICSMAGRRSGDIIIIGGKGQPTVIKTGGKRRHGGSTIIIQGGGQKKGHEDHGHEQHLWDHGHGWRK